MRRFLAVHRPVVTFQSQLRNLKITAIDMPALSPTMTVGTLVAWKKNIGDAVNPGDVLADVGTDKATLDFENVAEEGFMARHMAPDGTTGINVGDVIALLVDDKAAIGSPEVAAWVAKKAGGAAAAPVVAAARVVAPVAAAAVPTSAAPPSSPYAKTVAAALGVDARLATPTGGEGAVKRVTADDVRRLAAETVTAVAPAKPKASSVSAAAAAPAPAGANYVDLPVTEMRRIIASRLSQSINTEVPHYYMGEDVCATSALKVIEHLRAKTDVKVSINDYIVKAVAKACLAVPECNTHWVNNGQAMRRYSTSDVCVAVATPTGLLTPIVFDADRKGIAEISAEIKILAGKAREGTLLPRQFQGGTATVSNLGGMGVKRFTAIVNPPQALILAVGGLQWRQRIDPKTGALLEGTEQFMTVNASFDHRVVDGAVGAKWMAAFRDYMENPLSLLA